jgi:hypothetical protein
MLERLRFDTKNPATLERDLDRLVMALQEELRRIERERVKRHALADTVNGQTGATVRAVAAFETLLPVNTANGNVDVLLPAASRADAARGFIVERLNTTNAIVLHGGTRVINNDTTSLTLPTTRAAYLVHWDGLGFWTVNDAV